MYSRWTAVDKGRIIEHMRMVVNKNVTYAVDAKLLDRVFLGSTEDFEKVHVGLQTVLRYDIPLSASKTTQNTNPATGPMNVPIIPRICSDVYSSKADPLASDQDYRGLVSDQSKLIAPLVAQRWYALGDAGQQYWKDKARYLKEQFMLENPDYVYKPRTSNEIKRRGGKKTKEVAAADPGPSDGAAASHIQSANDFGNPNIEPQRVAEAAAEAAEAEIAETDIDDGINNMQDRPVVHENSLEEVLEASLRQFLENDASTVEEHVSPDIQATGHRKSPM
ncbi:hypothetical protein SLS62_007477 [Diatrype stigma]|uniref:Uncharacterized protein n=1 Tax=Diatrype stigma TaxID=117547 RepID=A0AAN9ULT9_9PEZI